jgi:hypothetical protein
VIRGTPAGPRDCFRGACSKVLLTKWRGAMNRLFILVVIFEFAAFSPANSQGSNPANATPSVTQGAATSSGQRETNPAFTPQGPCSVSPNATGGVTTSSSCGTDPLEVPTQTLSSSSSPAQVRGGTTQSAQSSGSGSSSASGGSSSGSSNATASGGATAASNAGRGAPSSSSTVCSSLVPSTSGTIGAGSLTGGIGC